MKDKLIIEFDYSKSDIHFTDEQMEEMVDAWVDLIQKELQEPFGKLRFNAMALATINVKSVTRKSYEQVRFADIKDGEQIYHKGGLFFKYGTYGIDSTTGIPFVVTISDDELVRIIPPRQLKTSHS